jgi:hypothetical protein
MGRIDHRLISELIQDVVPQPEFIHGLASLSLLNRRIVRRQRALLTRLKIIRPPGRIPAHGHDLVTTDEGAQ